MIEVRLKAFIDGLPRERVGLVLKSGEIVELPNVSSEPDDSFLVMATDMMPFLSAMVATWHTHPKGGLSPSVTDMESFAMWPDLKHYIVAPEGVRAFTVTETGSVIEATP
jgi:proteasome lid subunit RPN8/RPN11